MMDYSRFFTNVARARLPSPIRVLSRRSLLELAVAWGYGMGP